MSDFSHSGNPLHSGTLYLVSTTGDPEEPQMLLKTPYPKNKCDTCRIYFFKAVLTTSGSLKRSLTPN
jgi:hypothetical protein